MHIKLLYILRILDFYFNNIRVIISNIIIPGILTLVIVSIINTPKGIYITSKTYKFHRYDIFFLKMIDLEKKKNFFTPNNAFFKFKISIATENVRNIF